MELDLQVVSHGRNHETFTAEGDPQNVDWLQYQLRNWLRVHKWPERRWAEFTIRAHRHGELGIIKTAKAV